MFEVILYISCGVLLFIAGLMVRQLWFAMKHFTPPVYGSELGSEVDMPSVTVCIPARNEMHALTACLEKVIASDYQRLEIIVLDDVSGDDTSSLIKSFAHDGVRFVQGEALPEGWLGKNHALQGLLNEASGSYLLFMDVDTRITPSAVSNLVRYAVSQRASMVSVLPRREDGWRASVIFSPLRYFWEVIFHHRFSPATATSAWLISRKVLQERFNGFNDLKDVVQPESKLSASLAKTNEYRFLMSTPQFGIAYEKKWRSQLVTSTRLLFPLFKNDTSLAVVALLDLSVFLIPTTIAIATFANGGGWIHIIGVTVAVILSVIYGWYAHRVWNKGAILGAVLWPILIIQEIILIIASIIQYKRNAVEWKGRPVYWAGSSKLKDEP
jgi:glycosyltransferase involved in cell wall biosynthesis